jgi:hypothetical protein
VSPELTSLLCLVARDHPLIRSRLCVRPPNHEGRHAYDDAFWGTRDWNTGRYVPDVTKRIERTNPQ